MRTSSPRTRRAALAVLLVALAAPPAASAQVAPSLRLVAADSNVRLGAEELGELMDLGLWVAATGGDFQIRLQRPGYGRWRAAQFDPVTGARLRSIPARLLDPAAGLRDFIGLRFLDRRGRIAARRTLSFCPSGYERLDDDGPPAPTYLPFCGNGFPFARGGGWGIDRGWASALTPQFDELEEGGELDGFEAFGSDHDERPAEPAVRLRPGVYRVVARIGAAHRRQFAIPPGHAEARLRVRVLRPERRPDRRSNPDGEPARATAVPRPLSAQTVELPDPATLPDLAALPPWAVEVGRAGRRDLLGFAGSPWNAGPGKLVVEGYREPGDRRMRAFQYFFDASGQVTGRAPAGTMEFHDQRGHHHWHFLQFVSYRLLRPSGRSVVRARKQSFCLVSTDLVDPWVPGAQRIPDFLGLGGSACGGERSIWIRQQLPAGWGDTYGSSIAGQQFDITRVPNGLYLLEMRVNPRGELHETTAANNVARRRVVLSGRPGRRRVRVEPWRGIRD